MSDVRIVTEDFVWLFGDEEYPTTMAEYLRFRALYGVPETRWRPKHRPHPTEERE